MRYYDYYYLLLLKSGMSEKTFLTNINKNIKVKRGSEMSRSTHNGREAYRKFRYYKRLLKSKGSEYIINELEKHYEREQDPKRSFKIPRTKNVQR